jgi:DNA-binding MarR family transcriptional regulator
MGQAEILDVAISTLLRLLTIDERRLSTGLGTIPFNPLDLETLSYLHLYPQSVAKDVANYLGVRSTTMQSVIDRLHKRGLVTRDATALKGRAIALALTEQGMAFREQIQAQNIQNCRQMLAHIDENERDVFVKNMEIIAARYSNESGKSALHKNCHSAKGLA